MFDREKLPEAYRRLLVANLEAFYLYEARPYAGPIVLFWARCRPLTHSLAPMLGWEHYATGRLDRIVVACTHDNIVSAPHVAVVAAGIEAAMQAWDDGGASPAR
jgi:thioesterase domain-containing protein